jgi:hypothetical protein
MPLDDAYGAANYCQRGFQFLTTLG